MSWTLSNKNHYAFFTNDVTPSESIHYPTTDIFYRESANAIDICFKFDRATMIQMQKAEILDRDGVPFADNDALLEWLDVYTGGDVKVDVIINDSTSPLLIVKASTVEANSTLAVDAIFTGGLTYDVTLVDDTGFAIGHLATIFNAATNRVYFGHILNIVGNVLTLDTPLDTNFVAGSPITAGEVNMNVDGSVTPVEYGTRNPNVGEDIPLIFDVSRIMIHFQTSSGIDLSKFGDITGGITRGLVCRFKDGNYRNVFNVKTNGDMEELMFDFDIFPAIGNQQDSATGRLTFSKLGAVIRLTKDEDLCFLIQDDLTGLERLTISVEGSEAVEI